MNEWAVCEVKQLYDRFGNNYEVTLIDRAMKANTMIAKMKNDFLCALGKAELAGKIGTSQDYFKEEKDELKEEVKAASTLTPAPRERRWSTASPSPTSGGSSLPTRWPR